MRRGGTWEVSGGKGGRERDRGLVEDLAQDGVVGVVLGFGLVGEGDAVSEGVEGECLDVFGEDVGGAAKPGEGFGALEEGEGGAGGGPEFEEAGAVGVGPGPVAGGVDESEDEALDVGAGVDGIDFGAEGEQFGAGGDGFDAGLLGEPTPAFHHLEFVGEFGVTDDEFEKEAVGLGFGEGIGAFLFDGVLGGHDEERFGEAIAGAADGDLPFLHGLQEGGLDFGGGTVDFVGENEVGKDGAVVDAEFRVAGIEDHGADDVGGEEVRGELDAFEIDAEGSGKAFDQEGFGQAGHAFEENVTVGQEGDEEPFDDGFLANDRFVDFAANFFGPRTGGIHGGEHNHKWVGLSLMVSRGLGLDAGTEWKIQAGGG